MSTRQECERALAIYEAAILEFKNVVGVAIVPCDAPGDAGGATDVTSRARVTPSDAVPANDWCVGIYVSRKVPFAELEEDDLLPSYLQVIDPVKGVFKVPTRVIERESP